MRRLLRWFGFAAGGYVGIPFTFRKAIATPVVLRGPWDGLMVTDRAISLDAGERLKRAWAQINVLPMDGQKFILVGDHLEPA